MTHSTSLRYLGLVVWVCEEVQIRVSVHIDKSRCKPESLRVDNPDIVIDDISQRARRGYLGNKTVSHENVSFESWCIVPCDYGGRGKEDIGMVVCR